MVRERTSTEICCCGTYRRDHAGTWRYPWGDPVPGAVDVTLADLIATDAQADVSSSIPFQFRGLGDGHTEGDEAVVVGLSAPELQHHLMLSAGEIAVLASEPVATIDRELRLGNLPAPRRLRGEPLWSRPVVERWLSMRSGPTSGS